MMASPSSTGGLKRCPRSLPQTVWRAPTARVAAKTASHVHLPVYGGRERALHQRAALGERLLVGRADALRGNSGWVTTIVLHARLDGRVDDREDLVAGEVARGEHEVVPRDDGQHLEQLRQRGAAGVDHRHRPRVDARRAQLELEAHPHRDLAVRVGAARPRRTRSPS